jgi:hypothetical protein
MSRDAVALDLFHLYSKMIRFVLAILKIVQIGGL